MAVSDKEPIVSRYTEKAQFSQQHTVGYFQNIR